MAEEMPANFYTHRKLEHCDARVYTQSYHNLRPKKLAHFDQVHNFFYLIKSVMLHLKDGRTNFGHNRKNKTNLFQNSFIGKSIVRLLFKFFFIFLYDRTKHKCSSTLEDYLSIFPMTTFTQNSIRTCWN